MNDPAQHQQRAEHCLTDWLALHQLDTATCRRVLGAIADSTAAPLAADETGTTRSEALDLDLAWSTIVDAVCAFLPAQQSIIRDTLQHSDRIMVAQRGKSRKAVTLDNGPTKYPTILFSYRGEPRDWLVMAHEFGHALQIRASGNKFVPPIMRELCAFLAEGALLSHTRSAAEGAELVRAWQRDTERYFGIQCARLETALSSPATPYRYAWNYPIARYLAVRLAERCSPDWIWRAFTGEICVQDGLDELARSPCPLVEGDTPVINL